MLSRGGPLDRCVLLVDAGYLFAQGGLVVHGTKARRDLTLDAGRFVSDLSAHVASHCDLPILRTYWYDGARHGVPTNEHLAVARLPYVKLRLGRLNGKNQQKGVDALIYRDLMTLASERSVAQAYLLSGDDDLREGVLYAQDRGVRVVLIGIANEQGFSAQSQELRYEADEVTFLELEKLSASLGRVPSAPTPEANHTEHPDDASSGTAPDVQAAATAFAQEWVDGATIEAMNTLIAESPVIPKPLDVDLIRRCEGLVGRSFRGDDEAKRTARRHFWDTVKAAATARNAQPEV